MDPFDKLEFIKSIKQYEQKSKEWFKQRKGKLTASDVATALGLNPNSSILEVFLKKCGYSEEFTGNVYTLHGQKFETEAIEKYCYLLNKTNHEFGLIGYEALSGYYDDEITGEKKYDPIRDIRTNKEIQEKISKTDDKVLHFLAGSPDGIAVDNDCEEDLVMLEVKCPYSRKIEHGKCPVYYYPQIQLNLFILDLKLADYIEYVPANITPHFHEKPIMNIVRIHRNEKWLNEMIPKLVNFWKHVQEWSSKDIRDHPYYSKFEKKIEKIKEMKKQSENVSDDEDEKIQEEKKIEEE